MQAQQIGEAAGNNMSFLKSAKYETRFHDCRRGMGPGFDDLAESDAISFSRYTLRCSGVVEGSKLMMKFTGQNKELTRVDTHRALKVSVARGILLMRA